jgi:hypothetical protein
LLSLLLSRGLCSLQAQVLLDAHPRMISEDLDGQPRIGLHRLVESDGVFGLSPLLSQLLRVLRERSLSLIPLQRFVERDREFLAIDLDLHMLAAKAVVEFEVFRLCWRWR